MEKIEGLECYCIYIYRPIETTGGVAKGERGRCEHLKRESKRERERFKKEKRETEKRGTQSGKSEFRYISIPF